MTKSNRVRVEDGSDRLEDRDLLAGHGFHTGMRGGHAGGRANVSDYGNQRGNFGRSGGFVSSADPSNYSGGFNRGGFQGSRERAVTGYQGWGRPAEGYSDTTNHRGRLTRNTNSPPSTPATTPPPETLSTPPPSQNPAPVNGFAQTQLGVASDINGDGTLIFRGGQYSLAGFGTLFEGAIGSDLNGKFTILNYDAPVSRGIPGYDVLDAAVKSDINSEFRVVNVGADGEMKYSHSKSY